MGGRNSGRERHGMTVQQIADFYSEECEKYVYLGRDKARQAARLSQGKMRAYWCETDGGFHLGHLPAAVTRGDATENEHYDRVRGIDLRLPRHKIASRRWAVARQLRYDENLIAAAYADQSAGVDRSNPLWVAERRYAGELLTWLRVQFEQLAEKAQDGN